MNVQEKVNRLADLLNQRYQENQIHYLSAGYENFVFKQESDSGPFVIRISSLPDPNLATSRLHRHFKASELLSDYRLAPKILEKGELQFNENEQHIYTRLEYIDGIEVNTHKVFSTKVIQNLAKDLAFLHNLDIQAEEYPLALGRFNIHSKIYRNEKQEILHPEKLAGLQFMLTAQSYRELREIMDFRVGEVKKYKPLFKKLRVCLCHSDIKCKNMLFDSLNNRIRFVDWDSFGLKYAEDDVAAIIARSGMSESQQKYFYKEYLKYNPNLNTQILNFIILEKRMDSKIKMIRRNINIPGQLRQIQKYIQIYKSGNF